MANRGRAQVIEIFHLSFLMLMKDRFDQSRYVLKGGANLRYFFDSVRYSEDIDIDLAGLVPYQVIRKVDELLDSPAMAITLRGHGIAVSEFSNAKKSDTTQRWKVGLSAPGHDEVRTRIEFSNRNGEERFEWEAVPGRIVEPYAIRAPSVQHYTRPAATEQKISALAGRSTVQSRDVFDLDLLLRGKSLEKGAVADEILAGAIERTLELSFDAFEDQVKPFLEPGIASTYDKAAWEQIQEHVAEKLGDFL